MAVVLVLVLVLVTVKAVPSIGFVEVARHMHLLLQEVQGLLLSLICRRLNILVGSRRPVKQMMLFSS